MSLFNSSSKGVKFDVIGATITGTVKSAPRERQQTKFGSQDPDFWPNGDPKMQILVDLQTTERVDANDDGERTLYVASGNMKRAIGQAISAAGAQDILPGGVLTVQYVGNDPASKNPANPAKMYAAQYSAPTSGFVPTVAEAPAFIPTTVAVQAAPAAVPAAPQPMQAPFTPQPTALHPSGITSEQIAQLTQLRSAGIPAETIAQAMAAVGVTAQQIAVFDSTPF